MLVSYKKKIKIIEKDIISSLKKTIKANKSIIKEIDTKDNTEIDIERYYVKYAENKKKIKRKINKIDDTIVATIALHSPEAKDLKILVSYLKISDFILKISDNVRAFIKYFTNETKKINIKHINTYVVPIHRIDIESLENIIKLIESNNIDEMTLLYEKILVSENKVCDLQKVAEKDLTEMITNKDSFQEYYEIINILRKSKNISDKAMNIALFLMYPYNNL